MTDLAISFLLFVAGLVIFWGLRWITETKNEKDATGDAKQFSMPHDLAQKGLAEKRYTDGMNKIPDDQEKTDENFESDSYFIDTTSNDDSAPSNRF